MQTTTVWTGAVIPLHEVRDAAKLRELTVSMMSSGWQGRPLLLAVNGDGYRALTGSHRLEAARRAGLSDVPALVIEDGDLDAEQWDEVDTSLPRWEDGDKARWMREAGLDGAADLLDAEVAANA